MKSSKTLHTIRGGDPLSSQCQTLSANFSANEYFEENLRTPAQKIINNKRIEDRMRDDEICP